MDRRIDAHIARTQFGQIRTAAPPDWLEKAWAGTKRRGLDTLTRAEIDAEITPHAGETMILRRWDLLCRAVPPVELALRDSPRSTSVKTGRCDLQVIPNRAGLGPRGKSKWPL